MSSAPLILTLMINEEAREFFNELRRMHFPKERNYLDAHLTLFHNLPAHEPAIIEYIRHLCSNTAVFEMTVSSIVSIGNGAAYKVESQELQLIHKQLQIAWQQWFIPQDKQKLWPHITVQNKVDPDVANQLINSLKTSFEPFNITALGFELWEYKGGPWTFIGQFCFK